MQLEIKKEYTGFLSERGVLKSQDYESGKYTKQLPILVHSDGKIITEKKFAEMGGDHVLVFESLWQDEACHVEECMQREMMHLPQGRHREIWN